MGRINMDSIQSQLDLVKQIGTDNENKSNESNIGVIIERAEVNMNVD
mgnify:CR=1 FL=1